jgi:hypothetical protein
MMKRRLAHKVMNCGNSSLTGPQNIHVVLLLEQSGNSLQKKTADSVDLKLETICYSPRLYYRERGGGGCLYIGVRIVVQLINYYH